MQASLFSHTTTQLDMPGADIRYTDAFISDPQRYFEAFKSDIEWRQDTITIAGKKRLIPRLNAWYGDNDSYYGYSGIALIPKPWTPMLLQLKQQLEQFTDTTFNSVLLNYYRDGNDSVAWHSDNETQLGPTPLIASVSLGATRRFSLRGPLDSYNLDYNHNVQATTRHIDLVTGSLLIMAGQTQKYWHHQVAKTKQSAGARINLTFRRIMPGTGAA